MLDRLTAGLSTADAAATSTTTSIRWSDISRKIINTGSYLGKFKDTDTQTHTHTHTLTHNHNIHKHTVKPVHNGTPKKWPLFRGWPLFKVWSKILRKVIVGLVGQGIRAGHCWQVAVVQRWPLAQVWLYMDSLIRFQPENYQFGFVSSKV